MPEPEASVDPAELTGYLTSRGWRREGNWRGAGVWELEASGRLLIPNRREFLDDDELLTDAIRKLACYEDRPEQDLLLDIAEPLVDSQYFRMHPATPPGTTPLPSGLKAVQGIHELMQTAARTVEEGPRMLFERQRSPGVGRFLDTVMLGSARPGSYILTARVPVAPPQQPQPRLWKEEASSGQAEILAGREIVSRFHEAVVAAQAAAERVVNERQRIDTFDEGIASGISANMCKALADLGGHAKDRPFEIGFSWARGLPGREPTAPVTFTGSMARVLARAGDALERLAKSGHARITGLVENLELKQGEEPKIKIVGEFRGEDGQPVNRALWVIVSRSNYDAAIEAQRRGWNVDAEGQLVTANSRREMRPERFDILRPPLSQ